MRTSIWITVLAACGSNPGLGDAGDTDGSVHDAQPRDVNTSPRTVFVIAMENEPSSLIYGNTASAGYINGLLATAASTSMFQDELPSLVSEPHYVWMEAGTNVFSDRTFSTDDVPSASNSTASTAHLVTQLGTAGISWMSYQEGITSNTCPIAASGTYAPKHDPFIFFQDVSGNPPKATTALCNAHHKAYSDFAHDLQAGLTGYVFITPTLCHDMHGDAACAAGTDVQGNIQAGDTWLSNNVPAIVQYTSTHDALLFITWDEGDSSNVIPFLAIGSHVKPGVNTTTYTHGSMLKSIEEYLGVPVLPSVASSHDFGGMFTGGAVP